MSAPDLVVTQGGVYRRGLQDRVATGSGRIDVQEEGRLMKYTDIMELIRAHYESEDKFHSVIERIINQEDGAGREIAANKIRSTFSHYSGKKRDGYTVKPLNELAVLNKSGNNMLEIRHSDITLSDVIAPDETIKTIR